jgi:hypothetical protein
MAKTAEQILKGRGLTDADLLDMKPMLDNPRFRASIEDSVNSVEAERDTWKTRSEEFESLRETEYVPAVTKAEQEARKARLELAEAREQLKFAKDYGYISEDDQKKADEEAARRAASQPNNQPTGFNPDDPKFRDFAGRFSTAEGDAMAMYNYVSEEYRLLNGGSINEYKAEIDGRTVRGMPALRAEARKAGKALDLYAEEKFNWNGKRNDLAAKREQEREEAIRKDEREKIALQQPMNGNPLSGRPVISKAPWVPGTDPAKPGMPAMPWDAPTRTAERIERAYKNEVSKRTQ